ncbi:divergent polysaccharide deacetylase family protein [Photobacterium sanctipauli]|uniref:Divergent polysaccharide deacetylase family protein n=1 Tax=Photobacterium sanctipauli TaxID=1342794 RepID=A0A2T3NSP6_9GAMM|nr:divergent polysaccharide deacetylase family protein [Photobacterium sanctipauli]PSW19278.1 divergent polysaccharide deacetylase family protein [Photobacterium sanctipauli]
MRWIAIWLTLLYLIPSISLAKEARLAIVIDDLGYQAMPEALSALPPQISISILPDTPFDIATGHQAQREQRDVLLHMPMEPSGAAPLELTTLTSAMDKAVLQQTLQGALQRVPNAVAMNNHMGSSLTQNPQAMDWVMEVLRQQGVFFLDSRTTANSVAMAQAKHHNIPVLRRHVFLDHLRTEDFVSQQLRLAARLAQRNGYAVAIGHPYPVTLQTLNQQLPKLAAQGITLVRLSELYHSQAVN